MLASSMKLGKCMLSTARQIHAFFQGDPSFVNHSFYDNFFIERIDY